MSSKTATSGQKQQQTDGEDLTTILDEGQRADLTLLVANATESMRNMIMDNFSASAGFNQNHSREGMTEDQKIMNASIDPGTADVAAHDKERKLKEQFVKELNQPKVKTLKTDALKAYDGWREEVIQRVGHVVNSKDKARQQMKTEASAKNTPPQAPATKAVGGAAKGRVYGAPIKFKDIYPPTKTPLTKLTMQQRGLILHSILLLLLSLEHYNSQSRTLLLNLTSSLKLPLKTLEEDEATIAKGLLEQAKELSADEETKKKAEANRDNRKWKVSMATVAGAAIIGVTGGLAAPLVAAGVGSVMGGLGLGATAAAGYLGSVAGSTVVVGSLFGAYGGRMTGQMMDNYAREIEDFAFIPVHSATKTSEDEKKGAEQASAHDHKLRLTICISGWLTSQDEVVKPWKVLGKGSEVFALRWELEALLNLGNAMSGLVTSAAWGYAQKELIAHTIFADLAAAMWPIGLLKVSRVIDNPFSVAKGRADKAGEVLADALVNKAQGERPVTLIGYSLGARMIYTCLKSLAKRKAFGLVESAVLIGGPAPSDTADWRIMRTALSGRLVNVYSENDYVLGFMYRSSSVQYGVAGLQKVEGLTGVENYDVSEDVNGHLKYRYLVGSILKKIGFEDIDMKAVDEERETLRKIEEEEQKQSLQAQRKRLMRRQSMQGKEDETAEAEAEAQDMQKEIEAKTKKSLMARAVEWWYLGRQPGVKDAEKAVGGAASTATGVAKNPSEAGNTVSQTSKDVTGKTSASTQSYVQRAAGYLPNVPGRNKQNLPTDVGKGGTDMSKALPPKGGVEKATPDAGRQGYMQKASGYLPSLPRSGTPSKPSTPRKEETAVNKTPNATQQGYVQKAAGYLPGMPSVPSFGRQTPTKVPGNAAQKAEAGKALLNRQKSGEVGGGSPLRKTSTPQVPQSPARKLSTPNGPKSPAADETIPKTPQLQSRQSSTPKVPQVPGRQTSTPKTPQVSGRQPSAPRTPQIVERKPSAPKLPNSSQSNLKTNG
ncbi:MAG: hypothetical protein Q9160_004831 [Pyrenula sp. 1 TL-2023]